MPRIPEKPLFHVTEAVWIIAPYLGRSYAAVRRQIYREIEAGTVQASTYLGRMMIPRDEIHRILTGEPA